MVAVCIGVLSSFADSSVVTNVLELGLLSKQPSVETREFDIEATVAGTIPGSGAFVVTDGSNAAFVSPNKRLAKSVEWRRDIPDVRRGDLVHVSGSLGPTSPNAATACYTRLAVVGRGKVPEARAVSFDEIRDGKCDWTWSRVNGLVRDFFPSETNDRWAILQLCAGGETLLATIHVGEDSAATYVASLPGLIGRTVEICGFANPQTKSQRKYAGRIFQCPDASFVKPLADVPSPFDAPHVNSLRYRTPRQIAASGPVRACGRVVARWGKDNALVDAGWYGIIRLVCDSAVPPARGQNVEVVGFPMSDLFNLTFTHAVWREDTQPQPSVQHQGKEKISASDIFDSRSKKRSRNAKLHGRDVILKAIVHSLPDPAYRRDSMLVESAGHIIPIIAGASPDAVFDGLVPGCTVEVSGVCVLTLGPWQTDRPFPQIEGFSVVVPDSGSIRILARPPWWTPGRFGAVIAILFAALAGIVAWNVALRRTALRKGRELLRAQIGRVKAKLKTEERTHLAVELHDTLAQTLTGVSLEIDTAAKLARLPNAPSLGQHLERAARTLKSCRDELRNCLWDLRNNALEERNVDEAIRQTLAPHIPNIETSIRFNARREHLSDKTMHTIICIVRELVINAVRHGGATKIEIAGSLDGDTISFSVHDNGSGFDPASAPGFFEGHYGLVGISERVEALEGTFTLESAPGKGCKATIAFKERKESE